MGAALAVKMDDGFGMTVAEFLKWDDGTDTRYELIDGRPAAMAPPKPRHGVVAGNIARRLSEALDRRPPCRVVIEAGVVRPNDFHSFFVPDLVVTCAPDDLKGDWVSHPALIVEILSPSTRAHDMRVKLMAYRAIPAVREILLIDPLEPGCEIHRRLDASRWQVDLFNRLEDEIVLESAGFAGPLALFYAGLEEPAPAVPSPDAALAESDASV
jgi:Uma2 family endonuclease